ncbi:MAG: HAD-IA family hydrolase [Candidatus Micrarchaeaceae archaeon]
MLSNIIFDVGGVIIKYNNYTDYYLGYLAKKTGISAKEIQRRVESRLLPLFYTAKISKAEFYRRLAKSIGISEREVRWSDNFVERARINKQTIRTIKRLKHKYVIAYFSNVDYAVYVHMREMLKPYSALFDFKFTSCTLHIAKPKVNAFRIVLRKMGALASNTLFIDNDIKNVYGARTAGIKSVLFKDNTKLLEDLARLGVL